jgi:transcriptional regulator with XRE-family HTH domain
MYRYTESGLDNVFIKGMNPCIDDHGEEVLHIPNPAGLHRAIATGIVEHSKGINGKELRFLRTEMGLTQAELAKLVHCDAQTIARWEKGKSPIDSAAEAIVRMHAVQSLDLTVRGNTIDALSERCVPSAESQQIVIDGHDPHRYAIAA